LTLPCRNVVGYTVELRGNDEVVFMQAFEQRRPSKTVVVSALASSGIPLFEIGRVLGHAQLATTMRYAHHAPERLVAAAATAALAWDLPVDGSDVPASEG
jgi:hypothetical protein